MGVFFGREGATPRAEPTAVASAMCRLIEQFEPASERLFDDPLLADLLGDHARYAMVDPWGGSFIGRIEGTAPGYYGLQVSRTCFIDDMVADALARGTTQIVIVGAGFDTRAYRLPGMDRVHVFELDLPSMIEHKRQAVTRTLGTLPAHVTYAPLDLETLAAARAFVDAGVDPAEPTMVICEDVTQYLTDIAFERLLTSVASLGLGTDLVLTYVLRPTVRSHEGLAQARGLARNGPPWTLGLMPAEVPALLSAHGLTLITDINAGEYRRRYPQLERRRMKVAPEEHTLLASA
ncbi:class I SAM-dependent methyltransferase [Demequina capsici]|uniref:S-adenosyl-L-methionine-dependent methyltransferase n=1 Tax=Demequina capsici TaxID=3075620 RepID=A0AA96F6Z3_9MICO|nr:SAM-dependent methyltransferase [Demequina sp. OYTSA14]WNM24682.1 SAM-dependent methyltransferase [Demequina sp. OYTSA14]